MPTLRKTFDSNMVRGGIAPLDSCELRVDRALGIKVVLEMGQTEAQEKSPAQGMTQGPGIPD